MRIAFLQNGGLAQFGIMSLSAVLRGQGHRCEVFLGGAERDLLKAAARSRPDAIAFSLSTAEHKWLRKTAAEAKERLDVPVIVGGPHPTFYPDIIHEDRNIDAICIGEGEEAAVEFFSRLESGRSVRDVRNIWAREDGRIHRNPVRRLNEDLDSLPFPDREIYYGRYGFMRNSSIKRFLASRGCPYDCSYCHNHALKELYRGKGKYVRFRSAGNMIEEIKKVARDYGMKRLTFSDDTFILDRKWLEGFLSRYRREVGIPFNCNVRANLVDEAVVRKLKDAGCSSVAIGVESGNEKIRTCALNKHITDRQILDSCRLFRKYRIKVKAFNMVCLPRETLKEAWETVRLNAELKPDLSTFGILQPYPGLGITDYAISAGYLPKSHSLEALDEFKDSHPVIRSKDEKRIENLSSFGLICTKHPGLIPIVRRLIRLPPNRLFRLFSNATYGYYTMRMFGLSLRELVVFARKSRHRVQ